MSPQNPEERVVVLAPVGRDASAMAALLQHRGLAATVARDVTECRAQVQEGAGALLLTEEALQLPHAAAIADELKNQSAWSDLPVLILTSGGPERVVPLLESTAAMAGSVTLLERPISADILLRTVVVALNSRRRQYEVRRLLEEQRRRQTALESATRALEHELGERRRAEQALGTWASSPLAYESRPAGVNIALAFLAIAAAVVLRGALDPLVHDSLPFATLFGGAAVAVWLGGLWPAVVGSVLGYGACHWLFVAPHHQFGFGTAALPGLFLYAVGVGLVIAAGTRMRRAQRHAHDSARVALERQRQAERALEARNQAETKARESDERLRVAIKSSGILLAQMDAELRFRWAFDPDPDFEPTAVLGRRDDELDDSEVRRKLLEVKREVLRSGRGAEIDVVLPRPQGARAFCVTLEPLRDSSGAVVGVTSAAFDITDRKAIEEALRQSEERARQQLAELDAIYRTAPLGLGLIDREFRFRRINERLAAMNGYGVAEHLGRSVRELLPSLADACEHVMQRVFATGEGARFELKGETPAQPGVERIWDEQWYPLHDAAGVIMGVGVLVEDITDRKHQENALRESEELFRALAENVPQHAWMTHADGRVFWFNRRWLDYTGCALETARGHGWQTQLHPAHALRVRASFETALQGGTAWEDTFQLRGAKGGYRWFLSRAFPIRDAAGMITRWFGTDTDITVVRETQEALREAQRQVRLYADGLEKTVAERTAKLRETVQELEAFSYSIAHDMRAPLRSMIGYAELVREEHAVGLDEEGREFLRRISVSARRLDDLIQDVLNYSRIVREDLPLEPVDAGQLINDLLDSYPNLSAVKHCVHVAEPFPLLLANRGALTQVFSNLLHNAVKFVPRGATPDVRVRAEPMERPEVEIGSDRPWIRVWVEDNGIGIDPSVRPRLFQMFQRFTRPGLYEGTGMGLAIARKAVERMGGSIGIEPAAGKGSRFWLVLPAATRT